jgi:hydroxyacylglutathione hydrolase
MMIEVEAIPVLRDNYVWALHDGRRAVLVDPGESRPILSWLEDRSISLSTILVTHHHADHVGGIPDLLARHPVPVFGPARGAVPSRPVQDGERIELPGLGWTVTVLDTPGHTRDHVCYVGAGYLFCGDTLFSCGCGRLFEGTPAQMHASLSRLAALPGDTRVCCAHEYTLANIAFALEVEPDNGTLLARRAEALALRKAGRPTLPVSLATELASNPFLRCDRENVRVAASQHLQTPVNGGVETFAAVRAWKDKE